MEEERCENCRFYKGTNSSGKCRRHAPTNELVRMQHGMGADVPHYVRQWPSVAANEWCGEYERASDTVPSP